MILTQTFEKRLISRRERLNCRRKVLAPPIQLDNEDDNSDDDNDDDDDDDDDYKG